MYSKETVKSLPGIGPKKAEYLSHLKIRTIEDFLYYYPREYEDRRMPTAIKDLQEDQKSLVVAEVRTVIQGGFGKSGKRPFRVLVSDQSGTLEIVFFQSAFLEYSIKKGSTYSFYGKVSKNIGHLQMIHPDFDAWDKAAEQGILPVYPLTKGLTQREMRKWMACALKYSDELVDPLPESVRTRNRLCDLVYAVENIHFPADEQKRKEAKFRLLFEELFLLQLGLLSIRSARNVINKGIAFNRNVSIKEFIQHLPFRLTTAQDRVLKEIECDMESPKGMSRLIQGDVGSGKTALAAAAAYKAVKCRYQAALMAPTEILAKQHYESLSGLFQGLGVEVGLLTGSMGKSERIKVLQRLADGTLDFIIGTHAVIQPEVTFLKLGLVITDEQHRFGVEQRNLFSKKGQCPDILVMTATPIPRTLAVILYGDLDISVIDEMPPGRIPVDTKLASFTERDEVYSYVALELKAGRQAYVVAPLIEESESVDARSAAELYNEISNRFSDRKVGLLHGEMKASEKDRVMEAFSKGAIDVLVATVVIEVGIHVPNATIMVVENAERFGLATLHQLRGRVGRGSHKSTCFLITDASTDLARERTGIMRKTNDGFLIAEKDLELRGPGEFFGVRQHGIPEFRIADLAKHYRILETVRKEAEILLASDPELTLEENSKAKERIGKLFQEADRLAL